MYTHNEFALNKLVIMKYGPVYTIALINTTRIPFLCRLA